VVGTSAGCVSTATVSPRVRIVRGVWIPRARRYPTVAAETPGVARRARRTPPPHAHGFGPATRSSGAASSRHDGPQHGWHERGRGQGSIAAERWVRRTATALGDHRASARLSRIDSESEETTNQPATFDDNPRSAWAFVFCPGIERAGRGRSRAGENETASRPVSRGHRLSDRLLHHAFQSANRVADWFEPPCVRRSCWWPSS